MPEGDLCPACGRPMGEGAYLTHVRTSGSPMFRPVAIAVIGVVALLVGLGISAVMFG